jgi:16S rRNA (cytidine1402-2'-O)-methyltransferase
VADKHLPDATLRRIGQPFLAVEPGLHLVATPIGRLADITLQALHVLASADLVLCEDTRVSRKLLDHYGFSKTLWAYHDHNAAEQRPKVMAKLRAGAIVALISDAGTPLISDPGYKLVREATDNGLHVTSAPGASALLTALQLAALPTDRFAFLGFLPPRSAGRKRALKDWRETPATLVIYDTAKRIEAVLQDAADVLGDRPAAIARELTKRHEEAVRGTLASLASSVAAGEVVLKGEFVLVIGPPDAEAAAATLDLDAELKAAMANNSVKDAVRLVSGAHGLERRKVYARALELTREQGDGR